MTLNVAAGMTIAVDSTQAKSAARALDDLASSGGKAGAAVDGLAGANQRAETTAAGAAQAFRNNTTATRGAADALRQHSQASRLSASQAQQLGYQLNDFFVQVSSGGSAVTALVQQGSQLSGTFGGVGNALKAVGTLLTPIRLALGGAATAAGVFAMAALEAEREGRALENALKLTGNSAGLTSGQFEQMVVKVAAGGRILKAEARELLQVLATSGEQTSTTIEASTRAAVALSRLNGKSAAENAKAFAGMGDDVAAWAARANKAYAYLTGEQYRQIQALQSQGREAEAVRMNMELLAGTMEGRTAAAVGYLDSALNFGAKAWDRFWEAAKGLGKPEEAEQRLARLREELSKLEAQDPALLARGGRRQSTTNTQREALRQQIRDEEAGLNESQRMRTREADRRAQGQDEIAQASRAFQEAMTSIETAGAARALAVSVNALQERKLATERAYRTLEISGAEFRDRMIALETERISAEERLARQQVGIESGRTARNEQEVKQRTASVIAAQTRLIQLQQQRTRLQQEIESGAFDPKARGVTENPRAAFRASELLAGDATNKAFTESRSAAEALTRANVEYEASLALVLGMRNRNNELTIAGLALGDREIDLQQRLAQITEEFNAKRQQLESDRDSRRIGQSTFDERLSVLRSFYDEALAQEVRYQEARAAVQARWETGFSAGVANVLAGASNTADRTKALTEDVFSKLGDTLTDVFTTGKADWRSLERTIVSGITRIIIEQQAIKPLASFLGGGEGGGMLGSFFSSLFGGGSPLAGAAGFGDYNAAAALAGARANGGPVQKGGLYAINERASHGPGEILSAGGRQYLMARENGYVQPLQAGGGGGVHQTIHFNSTGAVDRRTQQQLATAAGRGAQQALARNG